MENICYILCSFCVIEVCVESVKICSSFVASPTWHVFFLWVLRNLQSFTLVDNNEGKQMSSCDWGSHFVLINPLLLFSTRSGVRAKGICFVVHRKPIRLKLNIFNTWDGKMLPFCLPAVHYIRHKHTQLAELLKLGTAVLWQMQWQPLIFSLHKNKTFINFQRNSSLSNERSLIFYSSSCRFNLYDRGSLESSLYT